jgi:[ribosomal protein S5]-alanine N-acetyltransferase
MTDDKYILKTNRCLLRPMNEEDADGIYRLNLHPDILKFTTDPPFASVDSARQFLKAYDHYDLYGFGRWAVVLKDFHTFIGWCGLKYHPDEQEVDVGYRLLPEFWGMGYATETARACNEYGFKVLGLTRIVARVHKENFKSIRVAEKIGMIYEKDILFDGVPWANYVILNSINSDQVISDQ